LGASKNAPSTNGTTAQHGGQTPPAASGNGNGLGASKNAPSSNGIPAQHGGQTPPPASGNVNGNGNGMGGSMFAFNSTPTQNSGGQRNQQNQHRGGYQQQAPTGAPTGPRTPNYTNNRRDNRQNNRRDNRPNHTPYTPAQRPRIGQQGSGQADRQSVASDAAAAWAAGGANVIPYQKQY
jgi:hypothetical protein